MVQHTGKVFIAFYLVASFLIHQILSIQWDNSEADHYLIISNKFDQEWKNEPINTLPLEWVVKIIRIFKSHCSNGIVVYSRNKPSSIYGMSADHQKSFQLIDKKTDETDFDVMRDIPGVYLLQDVITSHLPSISANEAQMRVFSESQCFISAQGGLMKLLAYFGGKQIVLHKRGREATHHGTFYNVTLPKLSRQKVLFFGKKASFFNAIVDMFRGGCTACTRRKRQSKVPLSVPMPLSTPDYCASLTKTDIKTLGGNVNYFQGEFGWEVMLKLPTTYAMYKCGKILQTSSCGDMQSMYYFSPKHYNDIECLRTPGKNHYGILTVDHLLRGITPENQIWDPPPLLEHFLQFPSLLNTTSSAA